jgi:hypothetical protein
MGLTKFMTQKEKRIKIAEACGWAKSKSQHPDWEWIWMRGESHCYALPDYFGSLDAMHEAERSIKDSSFWKTYKYILKCMPIDPIHATAEQRAEAFGQALNLW